MNWFYAKNGAQQGPLSTDEIKSRIAAGEIGPNDLAWCEGMPDWIPVAQISQLKSEAAPAPAAAAPVSGPSPYQAPTAAPAPVQSGAAAGMGAPIPTYLWQSIVVTIMCCLPFGIPAIVYATKVEGLRAAGDFAGAKNASAKAKKWCIISVIAWVVVAILYGVFVAVVATNPEFQEQLRQEQIRQQQSIEQVE